MQICTRTLSALVLTAGLLAPVAHAQLRLSGYTTGSFDDLSEANTTVTNAADHSAASFATGIPVEGSTQSKITFKNATFTNVGSGEPIQTGLFTITNGMTQIGSGAPTARFNLGLHLTSPGNQDIAINTITFHIDHTPNLPDAIPDVFSVSFNQPEPVKLQNTLVRFHVDVSPLDFKVPENATVQKGDIRVSFSPVSFTPVPEPSTYAAWGAAVLLGLTGLRQYRRRRSTAPAPIAA
jgi:MYXO-CTERM domain-containing protein